VKQVVTYANKGKSIISLYEMNLNDAFCALQMVMYVSTLAKIYKTIATFLLREL